MSIKRIPATGVVCEPSRLIETDPETSFCYVAIHFVEDAVLLAYCFNARIVRLPLAELYGA